MEQPEMIDYDLSEGEIAIYHGKQWVVTNFGMCGFLTYAGVPRRFYWLDREQVGEHCPNAHKPSVEYGTVTHLAGKAWVDLEEVIIAVRVACSHYEIDTAGWLNPEIEHARAVRNYSKARAAVRRELHPERIGPLGYTLSTNELIMGEPDVEAELAKRGIVDPDTGTAL
jgi:hypothetical protein